jgi:hypothetical protein
MKSTESTCSAGWSLTSTKDSLKFSHAQGITFILQTSAKQPNREQLRAARKLLEHIQPPRSVKQVPTLGECLFV